MLGYRFRRSTFGSLTRAKNENALLVFEVLVLDKAELARAQAGISRIDVSTTIFEEASSSDFVVVDHDENIRHDESQPASDEAMLDPIAMADGCATESDASSIAKRGLDSDVGSVHSDDVEAVLQEQRSEPSADEGPDIVKLVGVQPNRHDQHLHEHNMWVYSLCS